MVATSEIDAIERALAYSAARSDIECLLMPTGHVHGRLWFDTRSADADDADVIATAIRYLDSRGLLIRSKHNQDLIAIAGENVE